ncbi:MAG TPA: SLC13 family permease [Thermoplasmata archaeon]|nr:SLC13 family permease [Thermoplasmata archaeon]
MADEVAVIAAGVFVLTFVLLSVRSIRSYRLDRPAVALFGAALMIAFGVVSPADATAALEDGLGVLILLLGMMLLVAGLDVCGFFDLVALRIAEQSQSQLHFLVLLFLTTAVLSALVLNDTIVLLMTPIVVKTCRTLRIKAVPFLVGLALAANIGSVATPVGNPQNAYIAIAGGIPFATFTLALLPVAALSLGIGLAFVWLAFRRDLAGRVEGFEEARKAAPAIVQRRGLFLTLAILSGTVAAFSLSTPPMLPFVALVGGALVLLLLPALAHATPRTLFEKVDWSILILFLGLFIVMKGVETSGLLQGILAGFGGAGVTADVWRLSAATAVVSNLVSNVPAVLLLAPAVTETRMWLALAASSTLAGNATILGAAANIIVAQVAAKAGADISMKDFMKAGLPTALATVIVAALVLSL